MEQGFGVPSIFIMAFRGDPVSVSPVPGLEGIAGPLEQVSFHDHAIRSVNVELHLSVIIGEVLRDTHTHTL